MKKDWLLYDDIVKILYGATFLGGGGGGPLDTALEILEKVSKENEIKVGLLSLDDHEVDDSAYGAMIACMGSPEAMKAGTFGPDGVAAFEAFKRALKAEDKTVKYLYSGEMGGFNTFAPMLVAIYSDKDPDKRIPFLDVDGNGRAVPELNTSLNAARGFPPYPVGMGTLKGNEIISYAKSDVESEKISRGLCGLFNNQIGFSTWSMCKKEFIDNAVVGCVSNALKLGQSLENAKNNGDDPFECIRSVMECRLFAKAEIVEKTTEIISGFDCGVTTIQTDDKNIYKIDFQNENLVIRDESDKAIITVPEIITMVCIDEGPNFGLPLTNASTKVGMKIELILAPADEKWWMEDKKAYLCWRDCLDRVGYKGPQVKY